MYAISKTFFWLYAIAISTAVGLVKIGIIVASIIHLIYYVRIYPTCRLLAAPLRQATINLTLLSHTY